MRSPARRLGPHYGEPPRQDLSSGRRCSRCRRRSSERADGLRHRLRGRWRPCARGPGSPTSRPCDQLRGLRQHSTGARCPFDGQHGHPCSQSRADAHGPSMRNRGCSVHPPDARPRHHRRPGRPSTARSRWSVSRLDPACFLLRGKTFADSARHPRTVRPWPQRGVALLGPRVSPRSKTLHAAPAPPSSSSRRTAAGSESIVRAGASRAFRATFDVGKLRAALTNRSKNPRIGILVPTGDNIFRPCH